MKIETDVFLIFICLNNISSPCEDRYSKDWYYCYRQLIMKGRKEWLIIQSPHF